jgi:hypothetical protein
LNGLDLTPPQYAHAFSKAQDGLVKAKDWWKSCGNPVRNSDFLWVSGGNIFTG